MRNEKLMSSALIKAQDMKDNEYFEHVSPSGLDMSYFVGEAGYKYSTVGENLAEGYFSAQDVHIAWMNSEGHRENILSPDFEEIGVAVLQKFLSKMSSREKKIFYVVVVAISALSREVATIN